MRRPSKSRVRIRACKALTTYTRKVVCFAYHQSSNNWRDWTWRMISQREMRILLAGGDVEPVTRMTDDGSVQLVGYKATRAVRIKESTPGSLTTRTMAAAAMKPSDEFTRSEARELGKYRLWPFVGDDRATRVWPRPTAIETGYLDALLAAGGIAPEIRAYA